jgi:hypothetical protein
MMRPMSGSASERTGWLVRLIAVLGVVFLAFVLGAWIAWRDVFPFREGLRNAFLGIDALLEQRRIDSRRHRPSKLWKRNRRDALLGVTVRDDARISPGLTLIMVGQSAHLIETDGTIRHTWQLEYEKVYDARAVLREVPPSRLIYWRPGLVLPNGDLLTVIDLTRASPEGLALARLDRDSRPLWVFHEHVHHDFDLAPDGRIFVLGQRLRARPPKGLERLRGPLYDERLLILSPQGSLLEEIPLLEAIASSPYRSLANRTAGLRRYEKGDYLHSNSCELATVETAARFDFVKEGDVLLSFREMGALAILDPRTRALTWARLGSWHQQHDPDFLPNGHLLIFDNQGDWDRGGLSRVIEVEPHSGGVVWQWPAPGRRDQELWSEFRGEQQRLPNGNTLINEQTRGRLIEVTPEGDIVWEFRCPFPNPEDEKLKCSVLFTQRYAPGTLDFPMNGGEPAP